MTRFDYVGLALLAVLFGTTACVSGNGGAQRRMPEVGALYSVDDGEGWFRVAKVLVADDKAVHIRLFRNRFKERPTTIDAATLTLGTIQDKDGFGIGHIPLTPKAFSEWSPVFLEHGVVDAEELEGYEMWKRDGMEPFGR